MACASAPPTSCTPKSWDPHASRRVPTSKIAKGGRRAPPRFPVFHSAESRSQHRLRTIPATVQATRTRARPITATWRAKKTSGEGSEPEAVRPRSPTVTKCWKPSTRATSRCPPAPWHRRSPSLLHAGEIDRASIRTKVRIPPTSACTKGSSTLGARHGVLEGSSD